MIIQATDKLGKGTLDVASIKLQITAGNDYFIKDSDFHNQDIQMAIRQGFLVASGSSGGNESGSSPDRIIKCRSNSTTPLTIGAPLSFGSSEQKKLGKKGWEQRVVEPGAEFNLTESELRTGDMKAAIANGLISVIQASDAVQHTESSISIGDIFKSIPQPKLEPEAPVKLRLDTNEELPTPTDVIDEAPVKRRIVLDQNDTTPVKPGGLKKAAITTQNRSNVKGNTKLVNGVEVEDSDDDTTSTQSKLKKIPLRPVVVNPQTKEKSGSKAVVWDAGEAKMSNLEHNLTSKGTQEIKPANSRADK